MFLMSRDSAGGKDGRKPKADPVGQLDAATATGLAGRIEAGVIGAVASALSGVGSLIDAAVRPSTDVDTIKALADPTRLAILRVLMDDSGAGQPVMSAKELAEALGEPQ